MPKNPFGDDFTPGRRPVNPFGDEVEAPGGDPVIRIEHASRRIRALRSQLGAEGLSPSATRELLDEIAVALESIARAFRQAGE
ncbi:MAG TPA: hypothetical protein VNZ57_03715 [Longimicrobiales bacterium]|nr:hypothetical protein [Longimicrobiales bacterium]